LRNGRASSCRAAAAVSAPVFAGAHETQPSLLGRCDHASCDILAGPKGIAQGADMRRSVEKPLDGPGDGGLVALASSKQGEAFEGS
jgi:hypothetical protein